MFDLSYALAKVCEIDELAARGIALHDQPLVMIRALVKDAYEHMHKAYEVLAEKRDDSRSSGVDVPEPAKKEEAPAVVYAEIECPVHAGTCVGRLRNPAKPPESVPVEKLKELADAFKKMASRQCYTLAENAYRTSATMIEALLPTTD